MKAVELQLSDAHGVYIPQVFVDSYTRECWNLSDPTYDWAWETCGMPPDTDGYWVAWDEILNNAEYRKDGYVWRLHQDGDLWALCDALMTDEEKCNFGFSE